MHREKWKMNCISRKDIPSKLEIKCKKGVYFSFDFGWYSIRFNLANLLRTGRLVWGFFGLKKPTKFFKCDKSYLFVGIP